MRLSNKVAIITGGAEGIGKSFAEGFALEGDKLVIVDINQTAAESMKVSLKKNGAEALAIKTDVAQQSEVDDMVKRTIEYFGRIDILVNNAAMYQRNAALSAPVWKID